MWRCGLIVIGLALPAAAADAPPPERVPAGVPSPGEAAKRDALARYGVGRLQAARGRLPDAARQLEAAAAADPPAVAPSRDLVRVYLDLGRDPAAIRTARKVLGADPADADTAHTLARLLFDAKRFKEADDVLTATADSPRLASRPTKALAVLHDLARCRAEAKDGPGTLAAWERVGRFLDERRDALLRDGFTPVELDREAVTAAEKLGQALTDAKRFDEAATAFRRANELAADPKRANDPAATARTDWHLSGLAAAKGDPAAALAHLERFLSFRPTAAAPFERYAELLRQAGRGNEVLPRLRALADRDPKGTAVRWVLAAEQVRAGDRAGDAAFRPLLAAPADPALFRVLVRAYAGANRPRELLELAGVLFPPPADPTGRPPPDVPPADADRRQAFAEALAAETAFAPRLLRAAAVEPHLVRSPGLWETLGWLADRAGRPDDAELALRAALRTAGGGREFARAFHRLRLHLAGQRKWEEIVALCYDVPRRMGFARNFGDYFRAAPLAELGRGEEALAALGRDETFDGRREYARVLGILGRYDEMRARLEALLTPAARPEEVRSVRYLLAEAYLGLKQFEKAEAELRGVIEDDPDDALALNNLGYNLADQNRKLDEAERLIRRAVELERDERARAGMAISDNAAYLDSLGWVLFRRGKLAEARDWLEKAAALPDGSADPTVWDHLGDVCFRLGDKPAAKAAWGKAAERYVGTHLGKHLGRRAEVLRKLKLAE